MSTDTPTNERSDIFGSMRDQIPTRNVIKDDFGFEIPVETVPLPSGGKCYDEEHPLHNKDTVEIRAMTAREEDILTSKALIKKGTVISHLIKSCMIDKRVDPDSLLAGDRNALMIALRVTGYGAEYKVEIDCPACSERSKHSFNLGELPVKRLEIDPVVMGSNVFETDLPTTKAKVRFKLLTGKDEQEIMVAGERRKKQGQRSDNLITQRLKYSLVSANGISDKTKLDMMASNLPARDSLYLRKYIDKHEPGIEMSSWMDCPSCLEHSEVRLPLGAAFFWPDE
jgi:hypothetical protein|tara:strand:- start:715 stop:1563 length:849 start_codon:yes stop_codon:yes gene_type:complete